MFARINLRLLAVFAVLCAITHASLFNLQQRENELVRRQNDGIIDGLLPSGSSESIETKTDEPTSTSAPPSSTSSPTITSTSELPTSTSTSTSDSTTSTPTTSPTTSPTPTNTSDADTKKPTNTPSPTLKPTPTEDSGDKDTTVIKSTPTVIIMKTTVTIDGVPKETESTVTSSVPVATTVTQQKGSESSGKGMSAATKRTVIGVVVGIIGAVVMGALFFLAWRIWGRRKNDDEDDDDTLSPFGRGASSHGQEKTSDVGSMPSPFKTTLDQYHNPNAKTNVSSNF